MNQSKQFEFLSQNINTLKGVGKKIQILLRKKNIEKISDLLWNIPHSFTDRSNLTDLNKLEIVEAHFTLECSLLLQVSILLFYYLFIEKNRNCC